MIQRLSKFTEKPQSRVSSPRDAIGADIQWCLSRRRFYEAICLTAEQLVRIYIERLTRGMGLQGTPHGENWDVFNETTQGLLGDYAELSGDEDLGQHNAGITIIEVRRKGG